MGAESRPQSQTGSPSKLTGREELQAFLAGRDLELTEIRNGVHMKNSAIEARRDFKAASNNARIRARGRAGKGDYNPQSRPVRRRGF